MPNCGSNRFKHRDAAAAQMDEVSLCICAAEPLESGPENHRDPHPQHQARVPDRGDSEPHEMTAGVNVTRQTLQRLLQANVPSHGFLLSLSLLYNHGLDGRSASS